MHINSLYILLMFVFLASCAGREEKNGLMVELPPIPATILEDIKPTRPEISTAHLEVPEVFNAESWSVPVTGRRVLALLSEGIPQGRLDSGQADLLKKMADYLVTFQLDKNEDFILPAAALALVGIIYSSPEKTDHRYRIGMSRMMYAVAEGGAEGRELRDLTAYVVLAALKAGLPLLKDAREFYTAQDGSLPGGVKIFTMAGTEEDFLKGFNLPGKSGKKLKNALAENNIPAARMVIAHYYRDKLSCLKHLKDTGEIDLVEAGDLLKNIFILRAHMLKRHRFGPVVDWTTVLDGDIESNVSLNHHPHLLLLARAWQQTGDVRFRDHLIELMHSWLDQSPRPDIGREFQWRTLEVGDRAANRWPDILAIGAGDSVFVRELFYPMIHCLYQHADYLMVHNFPRANNWSQVEAAGLLSAAMILSEHRNADTYHSTALRRFKYLNRVLYLPDGMQAENSVYYHTFPIGTQINVFRLARSLNAVPDTSWIGVLERGIEALVLSALPDGSIPMVSDVGPRKSYIRSWQKQGQALFPDNPLFQYPVGAQETVSVEPPEVTGYCFNWAGYGIMRQDWTPQSQYLLFDMGFYGTGHQHEDKLNIILYAYGRELLHDPGIYRYSDDGFERYFRGSRGHNLVLVDGKGQRSDIFFDKGDPFNGVSFPDVDSRWIDRRTHILARGVHRLGFADKLMPLWGGQRELRSQEKASLVAVEHERKILWVKGEYWVMTDRLTGEGSHQIEQVFHFSPVLSEHSVEGVDPGEVLLKGNRIAISNNSGVANIAVMQVGGTDLKARKQKGAKDPHVGWTSLYGEIPVWDVTFEANRRLPTTLTTVLLPLKSGENLLPEIRTIRQDSLAVVFDLVFGNFTDRVVLTGGRQAAKIDFEGGFFEGEALVLRQFKGRQFEPLLHEGARAWCFRTYR